MAEKDTQTMVLRATSDDRDLLLGLARIINSFDTLSSTFRKTDKQIGILDIAMGSFLGKLGYGVFQKIAGGVQLLTQQFQKFIEFAKGATMVAARVEVQWRTLALTAGNAGEAIKDMGGHVSTLRAYGIKTGEALESVTQFLATGLPVENLSELARRAQDMAVVIGEDSTEAFRRFNTFLQTGNSMWIRTMGITKTASKMIKEYADAQGLAVKALTDRQRKEALVQGLMKETIKYEGAYEEALKDPYKRWTSLPRLISNATEVLGHMFVPLMGTAVDAASTLLEKFESIFRVTKKGAYAMMAEDLGKAVEDLTKEEKMVGIEQYFGQWTDFAYNVRASVEVVAESITDAFQGLVDEAWGWGEGMGDNLTSGIINAFQNVVLPAIVQVTNWIADFLAPGSAPAKGPLSTIDRWGIDLMRTYMEGWTKVDFQIFSQVAGVVETAINAAFTAAGGGDKATLYQDLIAGRQLAGGIAAGGVGDMGELESLVGPLYEDLAKYLDLMDQYKGAVEGITAAEEELAAAQEWAAEAANAVAAAEQGVAEMEEWVAEATEKVSDLRDALKAKELLWAEIPERFVRGRKRQLELEILAAEEEEEARQDELDAAERALETAREEEAARWAVVEAYEEQLAAAEAYASEIGAAVSLQQQQIQELAEMMQLEAKLAAEKAKALVEEEEQIEAIQNVWEGVFDPELLEEAKERMRGMLEPLLPQVREIGENFGRIWEGIKDIPSRMVEWWASTEPVRDFFQWLWDTIVDIVGYIKEALEVWDQLKAIMEFGLPGGIGPVMVTGEGESMAEQIMGTVGELGPVMMTGTEESLAEMMGGWIEGLLGMKPDIEEAADEALYQPPVDAAGRAYEEIVGHSILPDLIQGVIGTFWALSEGLIDPMEAIVEGTVGPFDLLTQEWTENLDLITGKFDLLITKIALLTDGILGLPPIPEDLAKFSDGSLKVVTVNLQGSTFGSGVNEGEVRDWMWDAVGELV